MFVKLLMKGQAKTSVVLTSGANRSARAKLSAALVAAAQWLLLEEKSGVAVYRVPRGVLDKAKVDPHLKNAARLQLTHVCQGG
ncbi:hypothetical protein [Caballeronia insecticola]|uniref:hypothetical protein n=1 Tax=Caballeronia insecticola TaxID=758793 RepID=UPI0005C4C7D6|nr:hypothetical protein [Caballeronia insecticola]